jgi:hypothetical protein
MAAIMDAFQRARCDRLLWRTVSCSLGVSSQIPKPAHRLCLAPQGGAVPPWFPIQSVSMPPCIKLPARRFHKLLPSCRTFCRRLLVLHRMPTVYSVY